MTPSHSKASVSYLRMAPRKVRLVAGLIRGMDAGKAEFQLKFSRKRAAGPILKLLHSAIASARQAGDAKSKNGAEEGLYVKRIIVDQGPAYRRFRPRSRGRANLIKKLTSHVLLELEKRT